MNTTRRPSATVLIAMLAALAALLATATPARAAGPTVAYSFDPAAPVAQANAPLRIVLVGFKKGQIDESALLSQIPQSQRPGVLIPYGEDTQDSGDQCGVFFGANTLLDHGRCYYDTAGSRTSSRSSTTGSRRSSTRPTRSRPRSSSR